MEPQISGVRGEQCFGRGDNECWDICRVVRCAVGLGHSIKRGDRVTGGDLYGLRRCKVALRARRKLGTMLVT